MESSGDKTELDGIEWYVDYDPLAVTNHKTSQAWQ